MATKSNAAEALETGKSEGLKPLYLEAVSRVEPDAVVLSAVTDAAGDDPPSHGVTVELALLRSNRSPGLFVSGLGE